MGFSFRDDFKSRILKEVALSGVQMVARHGVFISPETAVQELGKDLLSFTTNIAVSNTTRYALLKVWPNPTYKRQIEIEFISGFTSKTISELFIYRNKNVITLLLKAVCKGVGNSITYAFVNYKDTGNYFRERYPEQYNQIMNTIQSNPYYEIALNTINTLSSLH